MPEHRLEKCRTAYESQTQAFLRHAIKVVNQQTEAFMRRPDDVTLTPAETEGDTIVTFYDPDTRRMTVTRYGRSGELLGRTSRDAGEV